MGDKGTANQGDDISGVVHEVGENVSEFKKGDRVAAFHEMMKPGEYTMFPLEGLPRAGGKGEVWCKTRRWTNRPVGGVM